MKPTTRPAEDDDSGISLTAVALTLVMFFLLCVVAGVRTRVHYEPHTVPRCLK